jgi:translocation and assembly module TamB
VIGGLLFDGEWDATLGPTLKLNAQLARSSGDLSVQAESADGVQARVAAGIRDARISLAVNSTNEGAALTALLRWDSARTGTAEGELRTQLRRTSDSEASAQDGPTIAGWSWPANAALSGQLKAQLPRLGAWSVLAPPGWRLRGSLATDMAISGSRSKPHFTGNLQADDLALRSVVDGVEFGNGRLRANVDGLRMRISEFSLRGAGANDSGGQLRAEGEASWLKGAPQVTLTAQLDRLRASIRSDRQVTLSGKLQASLTDLAANISGALNVDQARIVLPDESRPQLGDDVRVRTTQTIPPATPAVPSSPRATKIDVQIDLGNDFRIQGKGINTRMRGTLNLLGDSVSAPRLIGTIATAGGEYAAYGQRLDIETGVLRFTGPIDNPTLNILAIRPNLTQRVGVEITGTALLPRVRLYAQPDLPEAEKLAWLVLGRSSAAGGAEAALLQQAALALLGSKSGSMTGGLASSLGLDELSIRAPSSSGSASSSATAAGGAITLGKRFSRNFYAAYERSLSGAVGTLFMFYELSRRFTVRAQAGEQTAIDLIFTVPYE